MFSFVLFELCSKSIIGKEFIPPKPQIGDLKAHPIKPPSKEAIKEWFRKSEVPRGAGIDVATKQIAPWFHGNIIIAFLYILLEIKLPHGNIIIAY